MYALLIAASLSTPALSAGVPMSLEFRGRQSPVVVIGDEPVSRIYRNRRSDIGLGFEPTVELPAENCSLAFLVERVEGSGLFCASMDVCGPLHDAQPALNLYLGPTAKPAVAVAVHPEAAIRITFFPACPQRSPAGDHDESASVPR